jgi:hypothetical protein
MSSMLPLAIQATVSMEARLARLGGVHRRVSLEITPAALCKGAVVFDLFFFFCVKIYIPVRDRNPVLNYYKRVIQTGHSSKESPPTSAPPSPNPTSNPNPNPKPLRLQSINHQE